MAQLLWLSDAQWAAIEPHLPRNQPGARRVDDRWVISGIIHVLKSGCCWCDCPADYGPSTTIYNRFNRWSRRRFWIDLLERWPRRVRSQRVLPSTVPMSRLGAWRQRGAKTQAIGPLRGGQTTKIDA